MTGEFVAESWDCAGQKLCAEVVRSLSHAVSMEHAFDFRIFKNCFGGRCSPCRLKFECFFSFGKMFQFNGKVGVILSISQNGYLLAVSWLSTKPNH